MSLYIYSGGRVALRLPDGRERDVSMRLVEYLFEEVELAPEVVLQDIFQLVRDNPEIFSIFSRFRARAIVDGVLGGSQVAAGSDLEDIECLQIKWIGREWADGSDFQLWSRMDVSGVGPVLKEPLEDGFLSYAAGERQAWSIEFSDPSAMADLPILLESRVCIDSRRSAYVDLGLPCLGKVLEAIFYSLSFFGGPEDRKVLAAEIRNAEQLCCLACAHSDFHEGIHTP